MSRKQLLCQGILSPNTCFILQFPWDYAVYVMVSSLELLGSKYSGRTAVGCFLLDLLIKWFP